MKRFCGIWIVCFVWVSMTYSVFAGDVPEGLLREESSMVFIGTIENYKIEEIPSAPYTRIASVEVIPTKKIKGEVEVGIKQIYENSHSSPDVKSDVEYLFGCFDENNIYIYEIDLKDEAYISLVGSDKHDMTKRLEKYLNDGSFEKAEKERLDEIEHAEKINKSKLPATNDSKSFVEINNQFLIIAVFAALIFVSFIIYIILKKNKR